MNCAKRAIFAAEGLAVGYDGKKLIMDIDLHVDAGECILLCGSNGCGKSTLLRTLAGLQEPLEGRCGVLDGSGGCIPSGFLQLHGGHCTGMDDVGGLSVKRRLTQGRHYDAILGSEEGSCLEHPGNVILVPARIPKVEGFTLEEFISTSCYRETGWLGHVPARVHSKVENAMGLLGIERLRDRDISTLSDGEFQKAGIATALVRDAVLILLDEPTAFLDVDSREEVLRTLHSLDTAVIFSSHNIEAAARKCTRVLGVCGKSLLDTGPDADQAAVEVVFRKCFRSFHMERYSC